MWDWIQAQGHQRQLSDSLLNDETSPGLWIKKNLDVIDCFPHLKLQALQMLGLAENCLTNAILDRAQCNPNPQNGEGLQRHLQ